MAWFDIVGGHEMAAISGLRQVEEFTTTLQKMRRSCYVCAGGLVLFALICVTLFVNQVDVVAFYSTGAVMMLIYLAMTCIDYVREEKRASQAYRNYLDTYSYQVLVRLARASRLSRWTRYEVGRYLAAANLVL